MGEVRWGFMTGWEKEKVITEDGLERKMQVRMWGMAKNVDRAWWTERD
jgi:hypothetical protein